MERICRNTVMDPVKGYANTLNNYALLYKFELALNGYPKSEQPCFVRDEVLPHFRQQLTTFSESKELTTANLLLHLKLGNHK
jgi:hypothetical protein